MHAPKTKKLTTTQDADQLFAAVVRTVEDGKYTVTGRDDAARRLAFTSGKTAFSWGHEYVAAVTTSGGGADLELVCGGLDNRPKALLDGRKNAKAAHKVLDAVQQAVAV